MTDPISLSPAAQAVLKAACIHHGLFNEEIVQRRRMVAAALRAAVDVVTPENYQSYTGHIEWDTGMEARNEAVRDGLLVIADELDGGAQ